MTSTGSGVVWSKVRIKTVSQGGGEGPGGSLAPYPALGAGSLLYVLAATRPTLRMVCPPTLTSVSLAPSHANQGLSMPLEGNPEGQHHTQTQTEACVSYCVHRRSCQRQDKEERARVQSRWPHSASSVTFPFTSPSPILPQLLPAAPASAPPLSTAVRVGGLWERSLWMCGPLGSE